MFRKYFFTSALLSLALVLVVSDVAQAQSRRELRRERRRGRVVYVQTTPVAMTRTTSFYYTPEVIPGDRTGHIQVMLPNPQGRVWIDDTLMTQTGTARWFYTPALTGDAMYRVRATWTGPDGREVTQEQVVPVRPGRTLVVNFAPR